MRVLRFILVSVLLAPALGCASESGLRRFDYAQVIMGVRVNIAAYCDNEEKARNAAREAFAAMARIDGILSDYRPDSEAMKLCDAAGSGPVPVSPELADVLRRSLEFSHASGGAFDVTAGTVVRLWRTTRKTAVLPSPGEIENARSTAGWRKVAVQIAPDGTPRAVLSTPGIRLDFGGIGKGFASDAGLSAMRSHGVSRCLVASAGDIAVGDSPPDRDGWRIDLPGGHIEVARCGVSTSGDTEQYIEINGVRYSHIVDPRTGIGVTQRLLVTTVAPDATTADAAATTLCVLAVQEHTEFVQHFRGLEARVVRVGDRDQDVYVTPGFPAIGRGP